MLVFISGVFVGLVIAGVIWTLYELKNAPLMPDNYDIPEKTRPKQSEDATV